MTQKIETENVLPEASKTGTEGLRKEFLVAPIVAFLDRFDTFAQKKKKVLAEGEMLFGPGENPYLYIVASGALGIFRVNPSGEIREVGKAYTGSFIGEGVLSDRNTKDVLVKSIAERTEVVTMDKEEVECLEAQDPAVLAKLYRHINNVTSMRLAESGKELSLMYESTQKLQEFQEQGQPGLLSAVIYLRNMLELDSVLMIEQHPYVPGLLVYKYNTKFPSVWPMNQKVDPSVVLKPGFSQPDLLTLNQGQSLYVEPMVIGGQTIGYLVAARKKEKPLSDGDIRILTHTSPMIATMLREVQYRKNEKEMLMKRQI